MEVEFKPKKRDHQTWKIFCQQEIRLQPKETKQIKLQFGVEMSSGALITSLDNALKAQHCSLQSETTIDSVDDVIISVQNNSSKEVLLAAGQPLCLIHYTI